MSQAPATHPGPWAKEFDDIALAFSGAFLFGTPLLFTMEMWWIGTYADMWRLLLFLALALVTNVLLAYLSGFRKGSSWSQAVEESIVSVAVGVVASTVMLLVLGRITLGDPLDSVLGKIVIQTIPLSIGASAANALLDRKSNDNGESAEKDKSNKKEEKGSPIVSTLRDMGATVAGGLLIGFSIAPTEEIPMLAIELQVWNELALIIFTLLITYLIVFESGFSPQSAEHEGPFQRPFPETALSYVVSIALSAVTLFMFGQIEFAREPLSNIVSDVLVLATPTAIGGAAGRVLIGSSSNE